MKIWANNIKNLTDARYFAAYEVAQIGFCLDQTDTENCIDATLMATIAEWVQGVEIAARISDATSATEAHLLSEKLHLDTLVVGLFYPLQHLSNAQNVIQEIVIDGFIDWEMIRAHAETYQTSLAFHLNFTKNNINWAELKAAKYLDAVRDICANAPVWIQIDIAPSDIIDLQKTLNPHGFVVTGGNEERVGFKSFEDVEDTIEAILELG